MDTYTYTYTYTHTHTHTHTHTADVRAESIKKPGVPTLAGVLTVISRFSKSYYKKLIYFNRIVYKLLNCCVCIA